MYPVAPATMAVLVLVGEVPGPVDVVIDNENPSVGKESIPNRRQALSIMVERLIVKVVRVWESGGQSGWWGASIIILLSAMRKNRQTTNWLKFSCRSSSDFAVYP